MSNTVQFRYDPPEITKLTVRRESDSKLELSAFGIGFGIEYDLVTRKRTAAMLIDGVVTATERGCTTCFTHRLVKVVYNRGDTIKNTVTGTVQIVVGEPSFFEDIEGGTDLATALAKVENNAQVSNLFNFSHF